MAAENDQNIPDPADLQRVTGQNSATDMAVAVSDLLEGSLFFNAPSVSPGRTSFEAHRLNDMIDLVQNTNPADLEEAGAALWSARDAITKAADELKGHVAQPDWEGESGEAFRKWGEALVSDTLKLADFADAAGTQITAAGTGLASVRSSMPPRDARADPKAVEDFPADKRGADNAEYAAAVKAEKHRQEAINQMNRLASFYAVSEGVLAQQEGPTFTRMPDVGVPQPNRGWDGAEPIIDGSVPLSASPGHDGTVASPASESSTRGVTAPDDVSGGVNVPGGAHGTSPVMNRDPATEIASVGTVPTATGPVSGGPGLIPAQAPPGESATVTPPAPASRDRLPKGEPTGGTSVQSRRAAPGNNLSDSARAGARGAAGRAANPGGGWSAGVQGGSRHTGVPQGQGIPGRVPPGGSVSAVGGSPQHRAAPSNVPVGGSSGIVGGRPAAATPPPMGPRPGQAPVVGGVGRTASTAGPAVSPGGRGVIGASSEPQRQQRTTRRAATPTSNSHVVGGARSRNPNRSGQGFSVGGTGLVRGAKESQRRRGVEEDQQSDDDIGQQGSSTELDEDRRRDDVS
jgi:hypothetical protein